MAQQSKRRPRQYGYPPRLFSEADAMARLGVSKRVFRALPLRAKAIANLRRFDRYDLDTLDEADIAEARDLAAWDELFGMPLDPGEAGPERQKREPIPAALRRAVFERDGEQCAYCGGTDGPFHLDHIHPVSKGGLTTLKNLTVACQLCNCSKNDKTLDEWVSPWGRREFKAPDGRVFPACPSHLSLLDPLEAQRAHDARRRA